MAASDAGDKNRQKRHVVDAKHKQPPARKKRSKAQAKPRLKGQLQASAGHFFCRNMTNCKRPRATLADQIIP